jgi:hypothetical protein
MKKTLLFSILTCYAGFVFCQSKIDSALYRKIAVMFKNDQKWRKESIKANSREGSIYTQATIDSNWKVADSLNFIEAKRIVQQYGFPGYSLVGENGSNLFWAIIQHCDEDVNFQQQVLDLMGAEVKHHNASTENYAYLMDRVLINKGQKQLYGTQVHVNIKTKHSEPLPIQDSIGVDDRRKAVGLMPLKDYLKQFDK